ncbi:hypothetical protein E2562_007925 [Oryza meyeriana var. granulata]|uniref:Uncharacterized protein n=1 Tax=Oryza meyeriana var. granulata TaxID=110450 RepID=A0A6G1DY92_9ORYZ|nr:hypothetical protein E2562_007925 [Oryza meyeriana var. granulata]
MATSPLAAATIGPHKQHRRRQIQEVQIQSSGCTASMNSSPCRVVVVAIAEPREQASLPLPPSGPTNSTAVARSKRSRSELRQHGLHELLS